jgi:hypothetical protein
MAAQGPTTHGASLRSTRIVQFPIFRVRCVRKTKPFSHASNLLRSHCKKIIQAFFLTESVTPPSVADETEGTIATVTSVHDASSNRNQSVMISQLLTFSSLVAVENVKSRASMIEVQRSQCEWR